MVQPEIIAYLRANLKKHPIDQLREQLASEGVSELDFNEALKAAMQKKNAARLFLAAGLAVLGAAAGLMLMSPDPETTLPEMPKAPEESAFVGHSGYVIRLPRDYMAVASFKDAKKTWEVVHFCKIGTDPTNFLNEGLFAQLGIVRLDVEPNTLAGNLNDVEMLSRIVTRRLQARGDKFVIKNLQVSSLRGIQITTELPNPGVEAFILGQRFLYRFTAGQVDEIYLEIVNSLRDPQSEN
jgi:hypothetical protein